MKITMLEPTFHQFLLQSYFNQKFRSLAPPQLPSLLFLYLVILFFGLLFLLALLVFLRLLFFLLSIIIVPVLLGVLRLLFLLVLLLLLHPLFHFRLHLCTINYSSILLPPTLTPARITHQLFTFMFKPILPLLHFSIRYFPLTPLF